MNVLKKEKQEAIVSALVEGASIRSVERMTGVHRDTIDRLLLRVGAKCEEIMDETMHDLPCERIELDECWSYVGKKQRHVRLDDDPNEVGDFWVWIALDSDSKLIPTYAVGKRDLPTAVSFVSDLASRLANRVQISTDGLRAYVEAIEVAFGADVDYAQIVKTYEAEPIGPGRYSPPKVKSVERTPIVGDPDPRLISTAFVERENLNLRMSNRRFTRLTNSFSKSAEHHRAAVALYATHHNFIRRHGTVKTTPAVASGVTYRPWTVRDLLEW
jgi:IS1 family transposase/lambda repressor-like predicted transcriptional regulator